MDDERPRTWRAAMTDALYGAGGFYVRAGAPAQHFRTAAHTGPLWASAIHTFATAVDAALGRPESFTVIDVGAGGGELLRDLADLAPGRWALRGVDVAPRPDTLPARVAWSSDTPSNLEGVVIATELLDVIPVDVVVRTEDGPRLIEVTASGVERPGHVASDRDRDWLAAWWPLTELGDRAEIGWPRDDTWHSLVACLSRGVAVAIDYAARGEPSLTGYRGGRQVAPVPDGSCDLTARVHFPSLRAAGDLILSQREVLQMLGIRASTPTYDGDAATYLSELSAAGEAAELGDPDGLGGFTWLLHPRGIALKPEHNRLQVSRTSA